MARVDVGIIQQAQGRAAARVPTRAPHIVDCVAPGCAMEAFSDVDTMRGFDTDTGTDTESVASARSTDRNRKKKDKKKAAAVARKAAAGAGDAGAAAAAPVRRLTTVDRRFACLASPICARARSARVRRAQWIRGCRSSTSPSQATSRTQRSRSLRA